MTFKPPSEISQDVGQRLSWMLRGIEAIDTERQLSLNTTNGRTRGARRWFVYRMDENGKKDYTREPVKFRAWDLREAISKANTDKRTVNRIAKLAATVDKNTPAAHDESENAG